MPRRLSSVVLGLVVGALGLGLLLTEPAAGAADPPSTTVRRGVLVAQVDGLVDPSNAELIGETIREANRREASLLVLKLNSGGAVDVDAGPLVRAVRESDVPIGVWIGPAGAKAKGVAALLAAAAPVASVSNGSSIGPADPLRLDDTTGPGLAEVVGSLETANGRAAAGGRAMTRRNLSPSEAVRTGATNPVCPDVPGCPTLGDFVVNLDGTTVRTAAGDITLDTAKVVGTGADRRRQPNQVIAFRKLDLVGQAIHTLTSPSVAYLLLVAGLALIVFEFFTISIGLAGGAGALAVVGAFVGFSHLPVTWWALVLVLLAMPGYAIDVQAGRPLTWTAIATVLLVVGSLFLYGGSSLLDVRWWVLALVIVGTVVFMVGAMPVAVRSRFSTPTVGREGLVGELGDAAVDVAPDGVVLVRGARWRARTNRATPIRAGDRIRVVEVVGLVLEVEPEEGGARDYRERRGPNASGAQAADRPETDESQGS